MFENLFISASVCRETISKRVKGWFSESSPPGHHAWAVGINESKYKRKGLGDAYTFKEKKAYFYSFFPFPFYFPSLPVFSAFNF